MDVKYRKPIAIACGEYGLQAVINDNNNIYVEDDTANSEPLYRSRFYLSPSGVTLGASDTLDIFDGYNSGNVVFKVQLQEPSAGTYKVRAGILDNGSTWTYTNWYGVTANAWNAVEISYQALANDGALTLWLNGNSQQSLSRIDNSARTLTEVRLGAQGVVTTTRGTLYFDNFESRRFSYIGTLPPPDLPQPQPPNEAGWTATNYTYSTSHPHAVTAVVSGQLTVGSYQYDANGNMTCRVENSVTYKQVYNADREAPPKRSGAGEPPVQSSANRDWHLCFADGLLRSMGLRL